MPRPHCTKISINLSFLRILFEQELQFTDDRYVNHLKQQTDELDLVIEKMELQMNVLTTAYREEMAHLEVGQH